MRILVGTLYTIENEYEACLAGIRRQTHSEYEHFVIANLPNKQAHDRLYSTFMERAHEFDLFLKVDADMVITNEKLFAGIVETFVQHPEFDMLTILLHDFFTDGLIYGMHASRSTVGWSKQSSMVFTDDQSVPREKILVDRTNLAPAALHCPDPSPFQAFHFGLHRGVKLRSALADPEQRIHHLNGCLAEIRGVYRHFLRNEDRRLGFAALGAELAIWGRFTPEHISYSNPFAMQAFRANYAEWGSSRMRWVVRILRWYNRLMLYPQLRRINQANWE